jgi:hypothetical protein
MVAKISHGASLYGAVTYNQEKVNEGTARIISGNRMITDITGNPQHILQQTLLSFEPYLAANRNTRKPVLHISLNPDPKDILNDKQLSEIAQSYMEKMNYGDQPYIVYVHEDTGRRHIHIVSVCVDETGRKISDSYERRRSMTACRELEIKYRLKNITDERKESDKLFLKKLEYEKGDVKHQISNVLKNVSDYRFRTFGEYSALLSCFNVEAKTVKGEGIDGKPFNGIVYSATDENGKAVSNPFKSSLFGKSFGYEGLNKKMARNEKDLKEGKYAPMIRGDIAAVLKTAKSKDDFIQKLRDRKIDAVFRTNEAGRLYGATFIDHRRKEVYNGSALGKEFSANVFHKLFNEISQETPSKTGRGETPGMHSPHPDEVFPFSSPDRGTALEDVFGIFDFPFTNDGRDYEEEAFQRQMKRRKKKKQQRHL